MKTKIITLFILAQFAFAAAMAQTYKVDASNSILNWKAEKITGFHEGTIGIKSGSLSIDRNNITSGSFTIDMMTIVCTDLTDAEYNGKLVGHLKSPDFFDVANFGEAVFTLTKLVDVTKSVAEVSGNLTIKNITKPLTFKAVIIKDGNSFVFNANNIVVDRSLYNIKYGSGSFFSDLGDKVIYDEFVLKLKLVVVQ
ncbi:MAG: YceI family protein [Bacteroidales bacterium]|nr:YceI family protein [Bacteroidales bacterium]